MGTIGDQVEVRLHSSPTEGVSAGSAPLAAWLFHAIDAARFFSVEPPFVVTVDGQPMIRVEHGGTLRAVLGDPWE